MATDGFFFGKFFTVEMTHLPLHHHSDYIISPIVFILGKNIAKCKDMPYVSGPLEPKKN